MFFFRRDCNQLMKFEELSAVGLDVFPNEPEVNPLLLEFANVTLLPHMGTETQDTQKVMEVRALMNLRDLIKGVGQDLVVEDTAWRRSFNQEIIKHYPQCLIFRNIPCAYKDELFSTKLHAHNESLRYNVFLPNSPSIIVCTEKQKENRH